MHARPVLVGLVALVFLVLVSAGAVLVAAHAPPPAVASNGSTPGVIATITVGAGPACVAVNPTTSRIYVANAGAGNVSVINGATNVEVTRVPLDCDPEIPGCIAVNSASDRVYVTCYAQNKVSVIDGATNAVVATVIVGNHPRGVAVNSSTSCVYVANRDDDSVSVFDCASGTPTTVSVGDFPHVVGVNEVTNRIYVANAGAGYNNVSVINGDTNIEVTRVPVGQYPVFGIAVNPATDRVYVSNRTDDNVSVINGASNVEVTRVPVTAQPQSITTNPSTNRVYVAHNLTADVWVIDGLANTPVATISTDGSDGGIAANPNTNRIYKGNYAVNTVSVIQDFPIPGVGGIAELPPVEPGAAATAEGGSSAPGPLALAGLAATGALLLVTGALYARRRWLR